MTIDIVTTPTAALLAQINALLPQLSSSAPPLTLPELEELVASPSTVLFVATLDDVVVGTLTLAHFPILTGRRAWIEDVVVDGVARGQGIGIALTEAAIAYARSLGAITVDLTSRPTRIAANALYRKVGFEVRETNVYRFTLHDE